MDDEKAREEGLVIKLTDPDGVEAIIEEDRGGPMAKVCS